MKEKDGNSAAMHRDLEALIILQKLNLLKQIGTPPQGSISFLMLQGGDFRLSDSAECEC